jgi:hypothetical protein
MPLAESKKLIELLFGSVWPRVSPVWHSSAFADAAGLSGILHALLVAADFLGFVNAAGLPGLASCSSCSRGSPRSGKL